MTRKLECGECHQAAGARGVSPGGLSAGSVTRRLERGECDQAAGVRGV